MTAIANGSGGKGLTARVAPAARGAISSEASIGGREVCIDICMIPSLGFIFPVISQAATI